MPDEMIRAAQAENVELAVAATILMKETGGGRNVWGHDPVDPQGCYVKGGQVTEGDYRRYRASSGGYQGCGPCQCTSAGYQDTADQLGGCWDPTANMRSGFRGMGALIRQYGVQDGARRYNGSGPAAEAYGRDFYGKYQAWQQRLADTTTTAPTEETDVQPSDIPAIWGQPVADDYNPRNPGMRADVALGWAVSHAAHANDNASAALKAVQDLTSALKTAKVIP